MTEQNTALWLRKRGAPFEVGPAPYTHPAANEVVVRARAVAVNPVDGIPRFLYRVVLPWLTFPAVVGSDVAGEVVEVGPGVTRLRPGDRVLGHAFGVEKSQNRAAEGAFQHYVVLLQHMVSPIPDSLSFEQAAVLPLTLSTAATGLFQENHLGLAMPGSQAPSTGRRRCSCGAVRRASGATPSSSPAAATGSWRPRHRATSTTSDRWARPRRSTAAAAPPSTRSWSGSATARSPARSRSGPGRSPRRSRSHTGRRAASASRRRSPSGSRACGARGHGDPAYG